MDSVGKIFLALTFVLATACTGEFELDNGLGNGAAASPDAGASSAEASAYFATNILSMMSSPRPKGACALCHQGADLNNGPDFLGPNAQTNYTTLLNSPRLIGTSPQTSSFYTRGDHAGDAFVPEELARIATWIQMEQ
jgi:mono/diheme cytochrome c family protein